MAKVSSPQASLEAIREDVRKNETQHLKVLADGMKVSFASLEEFQSWVSEQMNRLELQVDEFTVAPEKLANQPAYQKMFRENPSNLRSGTNVVGTSSGQGNGGGLLLFAHSDKFPETFDWGRKNPKMEERDGRLYAPGIADDVAGVVAMISAVETYRRLGFEQQRDLVVASVLGKQKGVYGTYGLMTRYGPMDSSIYVHPHESGGGLNQIHMTSVGQVEFLIEIEVNVPDTTDHFKAVYSKSTVSAAQKGAYIFQGLHEWATETSKRYPHSGIEEELGGHAFVLMVARFLAGDELSDRHSLDETAHVDAYSVPIRCVMQGTVMFPPDASQETVQAEFKEALDSLIQKDPELAQSKVRLEWGNLIGDSAQSDEDSAFMHTVLQVLSDVTGEEAYFYYGHTLSDARYPMVYWNAQSVGVGPHCGNVSTKSEWIDRNQYLDTIVAVTQMMGQLA